MKNLQVGFGRSFHADPRCAVFEAVEHAKQKFAAGPSGTELAFVTATVEYPAAAVYSALREALPQALIHGITTSLGVLGLDGVSSGPSGVVGILLFRSTGDVRLAVGYADIEADGQKSGRAAAEQILAQGGGARPALLLFNAAPGDEERILQGVAEILPGVPAFGGSAADHAIAGEWSVFTNAGPRKNAVSIAALFGNVAVGGALLSPYQPAGKAATVTQGSGRQLVELDGQPAAQVLNKWLDGRLEYQLAEGGNILAQTALRPLGIRHDTPFGPHYVTLHPAHVHVPDHKVDLFAAIRPGQELCLMDGSDAGLIEVLGELARRARENGKLRREELRAGVLIYCAGCAGSVGPALSDGLRKHLSQELGDIPLLGMCTFGEQGHIPGLGNLHQDLSVSLVLIGDASDGAPSGRSDAPIPSPSKAE
jgi:hypothetical protein